MPRQRLDAFTQAYIGAMLWAETDNSDDQGGDPLDKNYGPEDIDPETMELIVEDCADFQNRYADLLSDSGIEDEQAGHDFWLSRGGHGSGFFDEDSIDEEFQDPLQEAAESYGEFDLTVDDGVIYGPGADWYRKHHPRGDVSEARRPAFRPATRAREPKYRPPHVRPGPTPRDMPTENIGWREIPPGSRVELVGHTYVVTLPDGTRASAYWMGNDAAEAQRKLNSMVRTGQSPRRSNRPSVREAQGLRSLQFHIPPINRNQTIEVAYALTPEGLIERTFDQSDRSTSYRIHDWTRALEGFNDPWNRPPPKMSGWKDISAKNLDALVKGQ